MLRIYDLNKPEAGESSSHTFYTFFGGGTRRDGEQHPSSCVNLEMFKYVQARLISIVFREYLVSCGGFPGLTWSDV